jgi:DNA-binding PadR family transcriptional regulator
MARHAAIPAIPPHWFQILLALADQDRHGLGIMNDVLERTDGSMKLWPGMLYRNLSKLVDAGLVIEVDTPADAETGGGRPRFYRITALGRRSCAAEAERLAGFVEAARRKKLLKA